MIDPNSISTISDLRFKTKEVLKKASKKPVFLFHRSTPKGVILSLAEYKQLIEDLEDYHDEIYARKLMKENKTKIKWISHEEVKKQLGI